MDLVGTENLRICTAHDSVSYLTRPATLPRINLIRGGWMPKPPPKELAKRTEHLCIPHREQDKSACRTADCSVFYPTVCTSVLHNNLGHDGQEGGECDLDRQNEENKYQSRPDAELTAKTIRWAELFLIPPRRLFRLRPRRVQLRPPQQLQDARWSCCLLLL